MFSLPDLPFENDALRPHMSSDTLMFHHDRHHRTYVETLNRLVAGTPFETMAVEKIIATTRGSVEPDRVLIFNNAAQHWNHAFFWQCLRAPQQDEPSGALRQLIERDFGCLSRFREAFHHAGVNAFGSGWVWLVLGANGLSIITTHDAETPAGTDQHAILCCDLWEHAYYLDHQNRRAEFLDSFLGHLANWDFAEARLHDLGIDAQATASADQSPAPDPRTHFQSPEMLLVSDAFSDEEKLELLKQWHLDLDNRLRAEEEGMSASDPMTLRTESRIADEAGRVQSCIRKLTDRIAHPTTQARP
ncbi:MAG: superoxide dismutase [Novosphingobium sp.]